VSDQPPAHQPLPDPSLPSWRTATRHPPRSGVKVSCRRRAPGLGPNLALSLLDVSETGVRLLVREALARGEEVLVHLQPAGHAREFKFSGHVIWCAEAPGGHRVGVLLAGNMEWDVFQAIARDSGV
jgi:hypothetical protein